MEKINILIVDDNINLARTLSFILEKKGYGVETAKNGKEAVDKARNKFFSLILMDIKLPLLNGVEVYKKIKEISFGSKVFMMTAYGVEELIDEALKEGACDIFYKPMDIEKILGEIRKVLD